MYMLWWLLRDIRVIEVCFHFIFEDPKSYVWQKKCSILAFCPSDILALKYRQIRILGNYFSVQAFVRQLWNSQKRTRPKILKFGWKNHILDLRIESRKDNEFLAMGSNIEIFAWNHSKGLLTFITHLNIRKIHQGRQWW